MVAKTITVDAGERAITIAYSGPMGPQGNKGDAGSDGTAADTGDWVTDTDYGEGDRCYHTVTGYGKSSFRSKSAHKSGASTEPTVGGSWATVWEYFAKGGEDGTDGAGGDLMADGSVAMTGALTMTQISTPSEPASNKTVIYPKSDGKIYRFSNGGAEREIGTGGLWSDMPAAVTRVSDTSFSMPDASNANLYDKQYDPGTIVRWEKSGGGAQFAAITAAAYDSNVVTFTIMGNTLSAGFSIMKVCLLKAEKDVNILPGTNPRAAETGVGKTIQPEYDIYLFGARIEYGTACATTKGVWDINDDTTSVFDTKPEIAASATVGAWQVSNCLAGTALTAIAAGSLITTDYDSGHATTPGADARVRLWWMPVSWRYRS